MGGEGPWTPSLAEVVAPVNAPGVVSGDEGAVSGGEGERGALDGGTKLVPFFLGGVPGVESPGVEAREEASVEGSEGEDLGEGRESRGEVVPGLAAIGGLVNMMSIGADVDGSFEGVEGADHAFWKGRVVLPGESVIYGGEEDAIRSAGEGELIESGEAGDAVGFGFGDGLPGFGGVGGNENSGVGTGDERLCAGGESVDAGFAWEAKVGAGPGLGLVFGTIKKVLGCGIGAGQSREE